MEKKDIVIIAKEKNVIKVELSNEEKEIINKAVEILNELETYITDPTDGIYIEKHESCEARDIVETNYTLKSLLGL